MANKKVHEHLLAIVKAGLNVHPVGGILSSLLGDYLPSSTDRAIQELGESLQSQINALGDRLDAAELDRDEFIELFKSAYLLTIRTHRKEKIQGSARLLANMLLRTGDPQKLTYSELDHFIRALDALSSGALRLFADIHALSSGEHKQRGRAPGLTVDHLVRSTEFRDNSFLLGLTRELSSWNLVDLQVPQIRNEGDGNASVTITPLGLRFASTVLKDPLGS